MENRPHKYHFRVRTAHTSVLHGCQQRVIAFAQEHTYGARMYVRRMEGGVKSGFGGSAGENEEMNNNDARGGHVEL